MIKSQDDYPHYLLKMLKDPFEVETLLKGDYNHEFPPYQRVTWKFTWKFIGSYLEAYKTTKDDKYLPQWLEEESCHFCILCIGELSNLNNSNPDATESWFVMIYTTHWVKLLTPMIFNLRQQVFFLSLAALVTISLTSM